MKSLYLILNIGSFIVPFLFSFHPRLLFYKKWIYVWPAIALTAVPFIMWDIYFTERGVWGFNNDYLSGLTLVNLPVEEVLFFICIPYACVFTYYCLSILIIKDYFKKYELPITIILSAALICCSLMFPGRVYTVVTFYALAILLLFFHFVAKAEWLSRFYFAYSFLLVPFTIVNGILTGSGIDHPVVWYNNQENMGIRLLTIPVEDIFYGMMLILLNVAIFELLQSGFRRSAQARTQNTSALTI